MSDFTRLLMKELRELARPRYIVPLLVTPLILVLVAQGMAAVEDEVGEVPEIVVDDEDGGEYAQVAIEALQENADVTTADVPADAVADRLRESSASALIRIPDGFSERIAAGERGEVHVSTAVQQVNIATSGTSARTSALLETVDRALAKATTGASDAQLSPTEASHTTYVMDRQVDSSPGALAGAFTSRFFFLSLVIVFAVFGAGQLVINSMGSESENRTLETLLTMPVPRRTIVAAKLGSATVVGLGLAVLYTAAIVFAMPSGGGGVGLALSMGDYALIGASLALAIVDVLALALVLGAFANDSKGGQSLLLPIGMLTMAPAFITAFFALSDFSLPIQAAIYAIPSTHPVVAPTQLLFGDATPVLLGIGYEIVFALVMIWIAVRVFESDRLVTGNAGWFGRLLDSLQR